MALADKVSPLVAYRDTMFALPGGKSSRYLCYLQVKGPQRARILLTLTNAARLQRMVVAAEDQGGAWDE